MKDDYVKILDVPQVEQRLSNLKSLRNLVQSGEIELNEPKGYVNNHIHTIYSFSPYSPTRAIWEAKRTGLLTAGIVDHDSVGGINEFIEAGKIMDIETTVGLECRVSMANTPFAKRRLNNT
ncbi:MAG: PHP domain-containing protein, partial [Vallitaleaceae bacterium]|nr:PHP domain-containing protein [Vallitaleaceae bacterium]